MKFNILFSILIFSTAVAKIKNEDCIRMRNKKMEMDVIKTNLENINTTRTADGGPYKTKKLICKGKVCAMLSYAEAITKHLPGHPDADDEGNVKFPNINVENEVQAMIDARGEFEQASRNCKIKKVIL